MQKIIELHNIIKEFDGERILDDIDLDIYDKEFITILVSVVYNIPELICFSLI